MTKHAISQLLGWLVVVGAVVGGAAAWRFWRVAPELRFPADEALWQLLPYGLLLLLAVVWLLRDFEQR